VIANIGQNLGSSRTRLKAVLRAALLLQDICCVFKHETMAHQTLLGKPM
jgi:hypothetical protein